MNNTNKIRPYHCIRPVKLGWQGRLVGILRVREKADNQGSLLGRFCECGRFINYFLGLNLEEYDLRDKSTTTPITSIVIEKWEPVDNDAWTLKLTQKITYKGFSCTTPWHTDPEDSICAGECDFSWRIKLVKHFDGPVIAIKSIGAVKNARHPYSNEIRDSLV